MDSIAGWLGWAGPTWTWGAYALGLVLAVAALSVGVALMRQRSAAGRAAEVIFMRSALVSRAARARSRGARPDSGGQIDGGFSAGKKGDRPYYFAKIYIDLSNLVGEWEKIQGTRTNIDWSRLPVELLKALEALPLVAGKNLVYCGANLYGTFYDDEYYDLLEKINAGTRRDATLPFRAQRKVQLRKAAEKEVPADHPDRDQFIEKKIEAIIADEMRGWRKENELNRAALLEGSKYQFGYTVHPIKRQTPDKLLNARYSADGIPLARERGVDVSLCVDLLADSFFDMYDVAILLSSDGDFIPAVSVIRNELGKAIVQVGSKHDSRRLREHCSASLELANVVKAMQPTVQ